MKKKSVNVTVVIGAGSIGQAIAHRVGAGKHIPRGKLFIWKVMEG